MVGVADVGRMGGPPVIVVGACEVSIGVVAVEPGGRAQMPLLAQTRSVWQQPPPREEGHGLVSERQVGLGAVVVVVEGIGTGITTVVLVCAEVVVVVVVVEGGV